MFMRLKEFASEILEPLGMNYYFEMDPELEDTRLNLNLRKDLYLILKEAITNVAKYSRAADMKVRFYQKEKSVLFVVEDNGVGITEGNRRSGNGLRNMQYRARNIDAVFRVESAAGKGTRIEIEMVMF